MNVYKTTEGIEVISFHSKEDFEKHKDNIEMIKVVGDWFSDKEECYVFKLENGEMIAIDMWEIYKIQLHESDHGVIYKPVVIEHENDDEKPIEFIGFQLI